MCQKEKQRKTLNTPFTRFSSSFQQNDRNVSGHIILATHDLENGGQCKHLLKMLIFDTKIFLKNFQRQISLAVTDSKISMGIRIRHHYYQ